MPPRARRRHGIRGRRGRGDMLRKETTQRITRGSVVEGRSSICGRICRRVLAPLRRAPWNTGGEPTQMPCRDARDRPTGTGGARRPRARATTWRCHRPSLSCTAPGRSPSAGVQPRHRSHNHTKQITRRMEVEPTANLIYKSGSLEREPKGNCYFTTTPSRRRDHTCDPSATRHQDKRSFDSNADLSIAFARCLVAVECLIN
jgi:hypothetical protein